MNLLHDLPAGSADAMNVIVEIPRGSKNKYEIDKETGLIKLDRVNHSAQAYPFDYGFVPQTLWDDGDALDVVLLTTEPLFPGLLLEARPVAIMHMIDGGEADVVDRAVGCGHGLPLVPAVPPPVRGHGEGEGRQRPLRRPRAEVPRSTSGLRVPGRRAAGRG